MNRGYRSNIILYILSGFAVGLFIVFIYYYSLFTISGKPFSFSAWFEFHSNVYVSFLIDLIPFLSSIGASIQFSLREKEKLKYQKLKDKDSKIIRTAINIAKGLSEKKFRNLRLTIQIKMN